MIDSSFITDPATREIVDAVLVELQTHPLTGDGSRTYISTDYGRVVYHRGVGAERALELLAHGRLFFLTNGPYDVHGHGTLEQRRSLFAVIDALLDQKLHSPA